ncbi:YL1 nuclear protein-domain-containing protein [Schizothecium vesticola]|uniref:YL1 nuclear protein-domain-containing protein n=1 Tax=Schizothecium vesticola TaxID=314040 RepID=A0AA40EEB3_9PEZI|nr:YL1 nuclear protein-domain-containing protein [Schizothecium vesticola]
MANDAKSKPMPPDLDDLDNTSSSDDETTSAAAEPPKIEWLATTREKRSTAGNRMKSMLANEEPAAEDSDLELLFAEDEDDAGFTDEAKEDASDVHMDSSSDDEDGDAHADDLEGEKELERQAREKKTAQRKRHAQEAIPAKFRKKVRIEQPATEATAASPRSTAPPPRPKKKSERMSWIPTAAEMPTRASDRRTTKISKQQLHQKMVEDEVRRKKQVERMEKSAKRLEALKKPPMTQDERLREAALVEKRNSKSLNRWEVAEKQREEERLRKIAALNNRKLDGPVVTFWSGIQELEEGQLKHVGKMVSIEEKAPRKKRQSAAAALAAKEGHNPKADEGSKPPSPTEAIDPKLGISQPGDVKGAAAVPGAAIPGAVIPGAEAPLVKPETTEMSSLSAQLSPVGDQGAHHSAPTPGTQTQPMDVDLPHPQLPVSAPRQPATLDQPPLISSMPPPAIPMQSTTAPPSFIPPVSAEMQPPIPAPMVSPPMAPPMAPLEKKTHSPVLAAPVLAPPAGVLSAPILGQMPMMGFSSPGGKSNCLAPPNTSHTPSPLPLPLATPGPTATVVPKLAIPAAIPSSSPSPNTPTAPPPLPGSKPLQPTQGKAPPPPTAPATPHEPPSEPLREGKVTKSAIILQNFDETAVKDRQVQTQILFGRKMNKLASATGPPPLCVITNHPARYRDPKTGLPYYNSYAFKEIQRVYRGDYKFSRLLGAYVGSGAFAARGVPERFLDPTKKRSTPKEKPVVEPTKPEAGLAPQEGANAPVPVPPAVGNLNPAMQPGLPSVHKASPVVEARLLPVEEIKMEGDASIPAPLPATIPMAATPTPAPAPVPAPAPPVSAGAAVMPST